MSTTVVLSRVEFLPAAKADTQPAPLAERPRRYRRVRSAAYFFSLFLVLFLAAEIGTRVDDWAHDGVPPLANPSPEFDLHVQDANVFNASITVMTAGSMLPYWEAWVSESLPRIVVLYTSPLFYLRDSVLAPRPESAPAPRRKSGGEFRPVVPEPTWWATSGPNAQTALAEYGWEPSHGFVCAILLGVSLAIMAGGRNSPFLYFQFET